MAHVEAVQRVEELKASVRGLATEMKQLQANLERLHAMQCGLAAITKHWATWMERVQPATPTSVEDHALYFRKNN